MLNETNILPLQGGINFRDLGGSRTVDNALIKKGLLFRSGDLSHLTSEDCDYLTTLPLQHIIDYRDNTETQEKPDKLWTNVQYHHAPANPLEKQVNASLENIFTHSKLDNLGEKYMLRLYKALPFNNLAYQKLINLLQQDNAPSIVQHCAIGKDRTGIGSAITLFILGCDENSVMNDYLITQETLSPFRNTLIDKMLKKFNESVTVNIEQLKSMLEAKEDYLNSAIMEIKYHYGSIDKWLEQEYGVTAAIKKKIQENYLR